MLSVLDLRGRTLTLRELRRAMPRAAFDVETAVHAVAPICDDVRDRGAAALLELAERFDGVRPERLRVPAEVIEGALATLDPEVRSALEEAIRRARSRCISRGNEARCQEESGHVFWDGGPAHLAEPGFPSRAALEASQT